MSFHISIGLLEDISRITTLPQNFALITQSYNHTILQSPSFPLSSPSLNFQYIFAASKKQLLTFSLCSLHRDSYRQILAKGKFNVRQFYQRQGDYGNFDTRVILDGTYGNEVIMHVKLRQNGQQRSRNQGIQEIGVPRGGRYGQEMRTEQILHQNQNSSQRHKYQEKALIFSGPCHTRNFFSFLDPVIKGQSYSFIQPTLRSPVAFDK